MWKTELQLHCTLTGQIIMLLLLAQTAADAQLHLLNANTRESSVHSCDSAATCSHVQSRSFQSWQTSLCLLQPHTALHASLPLGGTDYVATTPWAHWCVVLLNCA